MTTSASSGSRRESATRSPARCISPNRLLCGYNRASLQLARPRYDSALDVRVLTMPPYKR